MYFRQIEDPFLAQYAYLIGCQATGEALLVDPERDIDRYVEIAANNNLRIVAVAETHIHADFVSGAREFAHRYPVTVYLSCEGGKDWEYQWQTDTPSQMKLLRHGDIFSIGKIDIEVVHTPGHTPEHLCFMVTDRGGGADSPIGMISGDFVFVGDVGRPDLLESAAGQAGAKEPSARALYHSLTRFLNLPEYLQVWPGHGAGSACGKALGAIPDTTVGYESRFNPAIRAARSGEERFVREILHGQPEPPLYFAQMKQWNKLGPPLLPEQIHVPKLKPELVASLVSEDKTVVIDTRTPRSEYLSMHFPGCLWIPLSKSFPTYAGSLIPSDRKIVVICDTSQAETAARLLWRIGLDNLAGYVSKSDFADWILTKQCAATMEIISFDELQDRNSSYFILDVRGEAEFDESHFPNAVCVPHTRIMTRLNELPKSGQIAVYCSTGSRSASVASLLLKLGFRVTAVNQDIEAAAPYLIQDAVVQ